MTTYKLEFHEAALKEWRKLGATVQGQFKAKLKERLQDPRVPSARLLGPKERYKIKLRTSGYRLVYDVVDSRVVVRVIAVGKRDRSQVYAKADRR